MQYTIFIFDYKNIVINTNLNHNDTIYTIYNINKQLINNIKSKSPSLYVKGLQPFP